MIIVWQDNVAGFAGALVYVTLAGAILSSQIAAAVSVAAGMPVRGGIPVSYSITCGL